MTKNETKNLISCCEIGDYIGDELSDFAAAFNPELIYELAFLGAEQAKTNSFSEVKTPFLGVKLHRFKAGFSEDVCLSAGCISAFSRGIIRANLSPLLDGCYLESGDQEFLDLEPNWAMIHSHIIKPFTLASGKNAAVLTSEQPLLGKYSAVNLKIAGQLSTKGVKTLPFDMISIKRGENSENSDKIQKILLKCAEESVVLLKNSGVLPLKKGEKCAAFGHFACEDFAEVNKSQPWFVGRAEGFELSGGRNDELMHKAFYLVSNSDAALIFLGQNGEIDPLSAGAQLTSKLPQNQLNLIESLKKSGKKLVGVIGAGDVLDMSFAEELDGLIMLPKAKYAATALTKILSGAANPSGKLPYSLTAPKDALDFKEQKEAGKLKVGGFIGYLGFDTANKREKFPFGFGLSYTKFDYKKIKYRGNNVEVTIKNIGDFDGFEVVQLYIAKENSAVLRPKKQLNAFKKVFIRAGETRVVMLAIDSAAMAVFDKIEQNERVEKGTYIAYVGASAQNIRLKKEFKVAGAALNADGEKLSDYIDTVSNIVDGAYALEAKRTNIFDRILGVFGKKSDIDALENEPQNEQFIDEISFERLFGEELAEKKNEKRSAVRSEKIATKRVGFKELLDKIKMENPQLLVAECYAKRDCVPLKIDLSNAEFMLSCAEEESKFLLSEEAFKQIDKLEIKPKNWRAVERFSSLLLAQGYDEEAALKETIKEIEGGFLC